jgi:tetratricopeptide (TPR) repeat protein
MYRSGAEAGSIEATFNLALLLADEPERQDESERISQDLIDAGMPDGFNSLGALRAMQGRIDEAEAAFQASIRGGDTSAYVNLGIMLAGQHGRLEEAEKALRAGIANAHLSAYFHLGILLARLGGREAEAKRALESAAAAGVSEAGLILDTLRSKDQGTLESTTTSPECGDLQ